MRTTKKLLIEMRSWSTSSVLLAAWVALVPALTSALYSRGSGVVDLTAGNFDGKVKSSDGVWIVEFYAPW